MYQTVLVNNVSMNKIYRSRAYKHPLTLPNTPTINQVFQHTKILLTAILYIFLLVDNFALWPNIFTMWPFDTVLVDIRELNENHWTMICAPCNHIGFISINCGCLCMQTNEHVSIIYGWKLLINDNYLATRFVS